MPTLLILRGTMGSGKTTVVKGLRDKRPSATIIDVDEIKVAKYRTTLRCDVNVEFPDAGRLAKIALDDGRDAAVAEPLVSREYVDLVLGGAGRTERSPDVVFVWLECSKEMAIARHGDRYAASTYDNEFQSYRTRYRPPGEHVIGTDGLTDAVIIERVLRLLP